MFVKSSARHDTAIVDPRPLKDSMRIRQDLQDNDGCSQANHVHPVKKNSPETPKKSQKILPQCFTKFICTNRSSSATIVK